MVVSAPDTVLLAGRDLHFAYGENQILAGVDIDVRAGRMLCVIGPNGSGKSTLLGLLTGLMRPQRGRVSLGGEDIADMPRARVARQVGLAPQAPQLAPGLSVLETVLAGRFALMGGRQFENQADLDVARRAMERTGVAHLAQRPAGALSGGERQRLALARALAAEPRVLLLDEPTSALDLDHQLGAMAMLERACLEDGIGVCLVSHDLNLASLFCHRLMLIAGGKVLADGPPQTVITPEMLRQAYGVAVNVDQEPSRGRPRVTLLAPPAPDAAI